MEKRHSPLQIYLFITMMMSFFVMTEPSPYDLLMVLFLSTLLLSAQVSFNETVSIPIILGIAFLLTNLISMFFVQYPSSAITYFVITCYLVGTFILLVGISRKIEGQISYFILKGYFWAAIIASTIGVMAYFNIIPFSETFLLFGRAKSTFKDPNVFGPFLVLPALFAVSMMELKRILILKKCFYFIGFLMLISGVLLSFSRAAWGNFAISFAVFFILVKKEMIRIRIKTILLLVVVGTPVFIYFIQVPLVNELLISRMSYQNYDDNRFKTQKEAYLSGIFNPLGLGGGQSDIVFQRSPHSLFARVFMENGVLGLLSIILLFIVSLVESYRKYRTSKSDLGNLYLVIFASIIGLIFNSFFIDSLHWRHLWVTLAMAWGFFVTEENSN